MERCPRKCFVTFLVFLVYVSIDLLDLVTYLFSSAYTYYLNFFFKEKMQKFISVIEESGVSLSEPDVYVALENQGRAQDYRLSLAFPFSITPCET